MSELPPDVRDRAAIAAQETFYDGTKMAHNSWTRVVDAVAAVVAPEIERPLQARVENLLAHNAEHRAQADDLQEWNERLETERDALKARVAELKRQVDVSERFANNMYVEAAQATDERDALQARVDLLATALTELVSLYDGTHAAFTPRSIAGGPLSAAFSNAYDNARAALSATPAAPVPHTCQLPDIATVREPSRRWDCRVCDARWIAMGRIVGRRSRYEWHQMPVTKTATPTGCRFCGEPESDTVWCCDERMEADGPTESEAP